MADVARTRKLPYVVKLERGHHYWCACGRSKRQPYCDGSHHSTTTSPVLITQVEAGEVKLCGCKQSRNGPYCDCSHERL